MTFSVQEESQDQMELKYCESCGALRLRPVASLEIYCPDCQERIGQVAMAKRPQRALRPAPTSASDRSGNE